jgi:mannose-1-phosphate guanylyltransferase
MLPAMLLAAGLGTRLRPLTDQRAKALVPVGDHPVLAHILDCVREAGVDRIVVNAHHRADDVQDFVRREGRGVTVSEERELLGTAGGVARAKEWLGAGDVVVWNADILAGIDVRSLVRAHSTSAAEATLVVRSLAAGEGNVGVDGAGRIVRLRRERVADEVQGGEFVPVHVLGGALRQTLPERGCLIGDVYIPALRAGATLRAFTHEGSWHDVGSLESYLAANLAWLDARRLASWVGDNAQVARTVALDRTVVGGGASASGTGTLTRCVLWPGSAATAPLADAVVVDGLVVLAAQSNRP